MVSLYYAVCSVDGRSLEIVGADKADHSVVRAPSPQALMQCFYSYVQHNHITDYELDFDHVPLRRAALSSEQLEWCVRDVARNAPIVSPAPVYPFRAQTLFLGVIDSIPHLSSGKNKT